MRLKLLRSILILSLLNFRTTSWTECEYNVETTFNKIVETIKMVFFPGIQQNDPEKFRDIVNNSPGYNNLLYIATVFAELELLKDNKLITLIL